MHIALLFFFLFPVTSYSTSVPPGKEVARSDELIAERNAREALQLLETLSDQSAEVLWRLSRAHAIVGELEQDGSKEQKAHYEKALELARKAVEADPQSAWAHLRVATAAGKMALFKGPLSAKGLVNEVREASNKALSLAKGDRKALAFGHLLLGRAHLTLSKTPYVIRKPLGLAWGNLKESKEHLSKAVELEPNRIMNQLALAEVLSQLDEKTAARKHADTAASSKPLEVGDEKRIDEAKALIKTLQ